MIKAMLTTKLILISFSFIYCVPAQEEEQLFEDEINHLIKRLIELSYYQAPPEEIRKNPSKLSKYWAGQAEKRWNAKTERNKIIAELSHYGDKAIEPILRDLSNVPQIGYADILARIGTPKARNILLDVALGKSSYRGNNISAAEYYLKVIRDKIEAKKLLVAEDINVLVMALRALEGVAIDNELFYLLEKLLHSKEGIVVSHAGNVLTADDNTKIIKKKVLLLVKLIEEHDAFLTKKLSKIQSKNKELKKDNKIIIYTNTLCKVKGALDTLRKISSQPKSDRVRISIVIARAHNGDITVKKEVINIIQKTEGSYLRKIALESFESIGTKQDIIFVQTIAESDTFESVIYTTKIIDNVRYDHVPQKIYPIRNEARRIINIINKREK